MPTGAGTATATVTRWSRAFVAVGVGFFAAWHVAVAAGFSRAATVPLGLFGFVFHVAFGNAYALLPSYFARELAVPRAPAIHLPLAAVGAIGAFASGGGIGPPVVGVVGAASWFGGCLVFVAALGWTVRDNPTGRETATGETDAHRERIDRIANAAVPVVIGGLFVGSSLHLAAELGLEPPAIGATGPATTHVLAAGTAALLVFAVGFRLLPRLLVAAPNPTLARTVLGAGVAGPALLAADFRGGFPFRVGGALEAIALVGFAIAIGGCYRRSDRRRVGGRAILGGVLCGATVGFLGLAFAFLPDSSLPATAFDAHYRLAIGGFLGLVIVGVTYHFYPPALASGPGIGDRSASVAVVALLGGVVLEVAGLLASSSFLVEIGRWLSVLGGSLYAAVVWGVFRERSG